MFVQSQSQDWDTFLIKCNSEPISEDAMRFYLLYTGELKAHNESRNRPEHKHEIRKAFSVQLKRLWETNKALRQYSVQEGSFAAPEGFSGDDEACRKCGIERLASLNTKGSTKFIPLVKETLALRCRIEITLLRPEDSHAHIVQSGDLDNRIKTLFDGMRIPQDNMLIDDGETHYVLLQDDSLITEVAIAGDNLLNLPNTPKVGDSDVFALLKVDLEPRELNRTSWIF